MLIRFSILLCSALLACVSAAQAADRVFVFYGDRGEAAVHDAETLAPLARLSAPLDAFAALTLRNKNGQAAKRFLLGPHEVVVYDADFAQRRSIALPAPALPSRKAVALSADGSRLLVAARSGVHLIDTVHDVLAGFLEPGFPVAGVLPAQPGHMLVVADARAWARTIDVTADRLLDGAVELPAPLDAWGASPNRQQIFAFGANGLYDAARLGRERVDISPPSIAKTFSVKSARARRASGPPAIRAIAVTDSGRVFLATNDALTVATPRTNHRRRLPAAIAWTVSASGDSVFRASDNLLQRIDSDTGQTQATAPLTSSPTALSFAATQIRQAGSLLQVSAANAVAAGGTRFQLQVQAIDENETPQPNVGVFLSNAFPASPAVDCQPGLSSANGLAVMDCLLGEVNAAVALQLTVSDDQGRSAPPFNIQAVPPTPVEGLQVLDGQGAVFPTDQSFSVRVLASENRLPAANAPLTITTDPADPEILSCPARVLTGENGVGVITCSPGEITARTTVAINVADDAGRTVTVSVQLDPFVSAPSGLSKVSGDNQEVLQGQQIMEPLVVLNTVDDEPQPDALLNVSVSDTDRMDCPLLTRTNDDGIASFVCRAKSLIQLAEATVSVQVSDTLGRTLPDPFRIKIVRFTGGSATNLVLLSPDEIVAQVDIPVVNAIRVQATAGAGGAGVQGVDIYFSSDENVTFDPPVAVTDSSGEAAATVTLGCNDRNQADIIVGFEPDQLIIQLEIDGEPGPFAQLIKSQGDGQSGAPGQRLSQQALVALTADRCGNVVFREQVAWSVLPPFAAQLANVINESDGFGRVSALVTLGSYGGPLQVEARAADIVATFDLAVNLETEELRIASGNGQNANAGQILAQPLVAQVLGVNGFGVGGVPVEFAVTGGSAELLDPSSQTNGLGLAFTRLRVGQSGAPQQGAGPPVAVAARAIGQTVRFTVNGSPGPQAPLEGLVNGASFLPGWSPGSTGTIFGQGLSSSPDPVVADRTPFPTELDGVRVTINGVAAPLIFVSPSQINLQTPFEIAPGPATVVIAQGPNQISLEGLQVSRVQPGIFEVPAGEQRIAAALHADFSLITPDNPAVPGEPVQLFFTGGGPLAPAVATNQPGPADPLAFTATPVTVTVDDAPQQTLASVYAPALITAYQVNFVLSPDAQPGLRTLNLLMDGATSQDAALPVAGTAALQDAQKP